MARKYVVEVNPSFDYLSAVLRELRWKAQENSCRDPFLQRIFDQRKQNSPYKHVRGDGISWSFRFDILGSKHYKGASYSYHESGTLYKMDMKNPIIDCGKRAFTVLAEIETSNLKELTPEILLNSLRELEVIEIMSS